MIKNKTVTVKAPAKLNLFLEVGNKRPDGYHDIVSVMQTVSLYDTVRIRLSDRAGISLNTEGADLPTDERNTAFAAAKAYLPYFGGKIKGIEINIEKRIPLSSGLGGGSADAAAVLTGLNRINGGLLGKAALARLGLAVGADVPFCVNKGTALVNGIGEVISPCPRLCDCAFVIYVNGEKESTGKMYGELDLAGKRDKRTAAEIIDSLSGENPEEIGKNLYNAFDAVSRAGRVAHGITDGNGVFGRCMSGSGPSEYLLCDNPQTAERIGKLLKKAGLTPYIAEPVFGDEISVS